LLIIQVEMFKIRMQGQYGGAGDKKLGAVVSDMWREYGFRNGIMRGYWITVVREIPAYAGFYAGVFLVLTGLRPRSSTLLASAAGPSAL
jgi:solute carrier family 25 carnitine/acylcarnitine transporter 20/29